MADKEVKYAGLRLNLEGAVEFVNNLKSINQSVTVAYEKMRQFRYIQSSSGGTYKSSADVQKQMARAYEIQAEKVKTLGLELEKYNASSDKNVKTQYKLEQMYEKSKTSLEKMRKEYREMAFTTAKLESSSYQAGLRMSDLGERVEKIGNQFAKAGAVMTVSLSLPLKKIAETSIRAAVDLETAMANVQKVSNLDNDQIKELTNDFRQMSTEIPITAIELANIAEGGARLYKTREDIIAFTKTMADLNNTTNLTGEEGADMLMHFGAVTKMSAKDFDSLGSSIVQLGNNFATNEQNITEMGNRIASAGISSGMTAAEILGVSAAMSQMGIAADRGGSAFSKLIIQIGKEVELNGERLSQFAEVAGMSAEQFAMAWKGNSTEALMSFFEGLGKINESGGSLIGTLNELEIKELRMSDVTRLLSLNYGELRRAVETSVAAWKDGSALQKEAAIRYSTNASKIKIYQNRLTDLGVTIGRELLPIAVRVGDVVLDVLETFKNLDPVTQGLIVKFGLFAGLLGPIVTMGGAVASGIGGLLKAFGEMRMHSAMLKDVLPAVSSAMQNVGVGASAAGAAVGGFSGAAGVLSKVLGGAGLVLGALAAAQAIYSLCDSMIGYSAEVKGVINKNKELSKSFEEIDAKYDSDMNETGFFAKKVLELSEVLDPTSNQVNMLKVYIGRLNEEVPGLGLAFDDASGKINMSRQEMENFIIAAKQLKYVESMTEKLGEAFSNVGDIEYKLDEKKKEVASLKKAYDESFKSGVDISLGSIGGISPASYQYAKASQELKELEKQHKIAVDNMSNAEQKLTEVMEKQSTAQAQVDKSRIDQVTERMNFTKDANEAMISSEQNSTEQLKKLNSEYNTLVEDNIKTMGTLTEGAVKQSGITASEMKKNAEESIRQFRSWKENIETLTSRIGPGLGAELAKLGPEAASAIEEMVNMSDEELANIVGPFQEYFNLARVSAMEQMGYMSEEHAATMDQMVLDSMARGGKIEGELKKYAELSAEGWGRFFTNVSDMTKEELDATAAAILSGGAVIQEEMATAANVAKDVFGVEIDKLPANTQNTMQAIADAINGERGSVEVAMQALMDGTLKRTKDGALLIINEGEFLPGRMASAIESNSQAVSDSIWRIMNGAVSAARGFREAFERAGNYVGSGFAIGITSSGKAVQVSASGVAHGALGRMEQVTMVKSPSRASMKIGAYVGEGFKIGIEQQIGLVKKAAEKLAQASLGGLEGHYNNQMFGAIDTDTANRIEHAQQVTYQIPIGESSGYMNQPTYHFNYYGTSEPEIKQFQRFTSFVKREIERTQSGFATA